MTKRNLSIVSLLIQVLAAFLLFAESTFNGPISFYDCFSVLSTPFSFVFIAFLTINCLCSVLFIFKNLSFIKSKIFVIIPTLTLVTYIAACAEMYGNGFMYGKHYYMTLEVNSMFYIEIVVLLFNILVECIKRFIKIPYSKNFLSDEGNYTVDAIEKYKKLLDSGAISQEEFDIKKKELLGL